MAKILSVYNRLQAGDYENGNGGKRRVSRLTQFIHATLHMSSSVLSTSASISEMTYTVSSGTLNPSIPFYICHCQFLQLYWKPAVHISIYRFLQV